MKAFEDHPLTAATAAHIGLVQRKISTLERARRDSWEQLLTAAVRLHRAGEVDTEDLFDLYESMRAYGQGFLKIWNTYFPDDLSGQALRHTVARLHRQRQDASIRVWSGTYPLGDQLRPIPGVCVVYVLFDEWCEPVYVGSTGNFKARIKGHHVHKECRVERWTAYRCFDRDHAYDRETELLQQHKPRLNKRSSR